MVNKICFVTSQGAVLPGDGVPCHFKTIGGGSGQSGVCLGALLCLYLYVPTPNTVSIECVRLSLTGFLTITDR